MFHADMNGGFALSVIPFLSVIWVAIWIMKPAGAPTPPVLTLTVAEDDWVKVRGTAHKFGDSTKPHQPVVSEGWWG